MGDPQLNKAGDTAVITLLPTTAPQDAATQDLVDTIRSDLLAGQREQTWVVGTVAGHVDFTEKVAQRMPWLIAAVALLALLLLTAALRSVAIGPEAAVLNLLSVGAAYGLVVAVFQWGWGSSYVGIEETVPIPSFVPMLMFAIVFGLSMDYEVFLLPDHAQPAARGTVETQPEPSPAPCIGRHRPPQHRPAGTSRRPPRGQTTQHRGDPLTGGARGRARGRKAAERSVGGLSDRC